MKTFHRKGRKGREGKAQEQIKENESRAMKLWGMMGLAIDLIFPWRPSRPWRFKKFSLPFV
jgi:hypothetical protein